MIETGFDLDMLGDAKKYLEKWREQNREKTAAVETLWREKARKEEEEKAQQQIRREAHRDQIKNISEILHNQSLAGGSKAKQGMEKDLVTTSAQPVAEVASHENEDEAWKTLGQLSSTQQLTKPETETAKQKRSYVKKADRKERLNATSGLVAAEKRK